MKLIISGTQRATTEANRGAAPSDHDALIAQFMEVTGCLDAVEAANFLQRNNDNLDTAATHWFMERSQTGDSLAIALDGDERSEPATIGAAPASQPGERSSVSVPLQPENARSVVSERTMNKQLLEASVIGTNNDVERLVQQGARIDAPLYRDGRTCLHVASSTGNVKATQSLIQNRANIESKEQKGGTPLHIAASSGADGTTEELLAAGANIECLSWDKKTPMHFACAKGHSKVLAVLLKYSANIEATDMRQWTPLHYACWKGCIVSVNMLLDNGADLTAKTHSGWTPLHVACVNDYDHIALVLLEKGADSTQKDNQGRTPMELAKAQRKEKVMLLLEDPDASLKRRFYDALDSVSQIIEATSEDEDVVKDGEPTTMKTLLLEPIGLMTDFLQLKIFYTAVAAYHRMEVLSDQDRSSLITAALEHAKQFCTSPFHTAIYHAALDYTKTEGIIDEFRRTVLSCGSIECQILNSEKIKVMEGMIASNARAICQLRREFGTFGRTVIHAFNQVSSDVDMLRQATKESFEKLNTNVDMLHGDITMVSDSLNALKAGFVFKRRVEVVGNLLAGILNALSFGIAGNAIQAALALPVARIVDFGNIVHIKSAVSFTSTTEADALDREDQTTLRDLVQSINGMSTEAFSERKLDDALNKRNSVFLIAAAAFSAFPVGIGTIELGAEGQDSNPAPPSDTKSERTNVSMPDPPITEALVVRIPSVDHLENSTRGESTLTSNDEDLTETPEWEEILEALEEKVEAEQANALTAYRYFENRGSENREHFLSIVKRALKNRLKAIKNGETLDKANANAANFFIKKVMLLAR